MGQVPPAPPAAPPGWRVGHYEIVEEIGRGGMGVVYRARDLNLGRLVALKRPLPGNDDPAERKRLLREARAASRVSHPSIVPIFEVFEEDGVPWLAMELVVGGKLGTLLAGRRPLPIPDALGHAQAVASALESAHARSVLHRDVTPSNILITTDGRALLTDFGLARVVAISETSSTLPWDVDDHSDRGAGTFRYMSPEQVLGKAVDARSDLYSLGAVLYEMCSGEPAFPERPPALLDAILHRAPPALSRFVPSAPDELDRIVRKAMAKDPEERYQTARDLRGDLRTLRRQLDHADYVQTHSEDDGPGPRPPRRRHWAGAALALVAAAAGVFALRAGRAPRAATEPGQVRPAPESPAQTLAVVPFENATGDPAWSHLVEGVTDDLARALQQSGVPVRAREDATTLTGLSDAEIARRLSVARVARGRVSLDGGNIVLEARVIQAVSGAPVWSRAYRQPLARLGGLYATVAGDIAAASGGTRLPERRDAVAHQARFDAYEAYHKGRVYWEQRTRESLLKAIEYFKDATRRDPQYAQAWAGMADAYLGLGVPTFGALTPQEARRLGNEAGLRALAIDPNLAEVHATIGYILYAYDWNWTAAEESFRRSIAINPQYATAHHWYADYLTAMGRSDEAQAEIRAAVELEPLSVLLQRDVAWHYFFQGRYDAAVQQLQQTLKADPHHVASRSLLGRALLEAGRNAEGTAELQRVAPELPGAASRAFLAYADAAGGRRAGAEARLRELENAKDGEYTSPYYIALVYARLGRPSEALDWLERGAEQHDTTMTTLNVDPRLARLRGEPRFRELVRRMNFPQTAGR
jgi:eukaryotic-like serine/threonine-protein kinase